MSTLATENHLSFSLSLSAAGGDIPVNVNVVETLSLVFWSDGVDVARVDQHKLLHSTHQTVEVVKGVSMEHRPCPPTAEPGSSDETIIEG